MPNSQNNVSTVILQERGLRSFVLASARGIARVTPVKDFTEGRAVKVVVGDKIAADQFVVRLVQSGNRRKLEVLSGVVPVAVAQAIDGFIDIDENKVDEAVGYTAGSTIWLCDSSEPARVPGVLVIAS